MAAVGFLLFCPTQRTHEEQPLGDLATFPLSFCSTSVTQSEHWPFPSLSLRASTPLAAIGHDVCYLHDHCWRRKLGTEYGVCTSV